ncbi:hypothetical protein ACHWQZ_G007497 [Mnemiopsis leidyi]
MNYKVPLLLVIISVSLYYFLSSPSPLSEEELTTHLDNKVVLICGASSGIGEELAYQLAPRGARLVLVARSQNKLDKVREELLKRGTPEDNILVISFDFSDVAGSKTVVEQTIAKFGALDYLVSNHAAMIAAPFLGMSYVQDPVFIEKIFRVNLYSHIELAVQALPYLEKQKGHIFVTSSLAGEIPLYKNSLYCSTKHAMNGFFYSLQQELLAKESPVSLTIGAFGLIWTKEMAQVLASNNPYPGWATGSVEDCSRGMMEAYVTRPQTMTFPRLAGFLYRVFWYFKPSYHDDIIEVVKPKGAKGTGYKELVEEMKIDRNADLRKSMGYQQGYGKQ